MKKLLTKLSLLSLILLLVISCNSDKSQSKNEPAMETVDVSDENKKEKIEGPFAIKSAVISYQDKKLDGTLTATKIFYFDDYGNTLRLEETVDGETSTYLYDEQKGKGLTSFPGRKPTKISMRQGELNSLVAKHSTSGYVKQNDETIAGKNCTVYANNAKSAKGESQHTYWKHKGVLLKEINRLGGGYITEAISVEEKALDKSIFSQLD